MTTTADSANADSTDQAMKDISERFVSARLSASPLKKFPGALPESLTKSYEVQAHSIDRWPDMVAGWKIGGIPPEVSAKYGADRLAGPIFSNTIISSAPEETVTMPVFEGGFAAIEAEIVFELGTTISPMDNLDSDDALIGTIKSAYVGAEIASSPLSTINDIGPLAIVSDFGNNHGLIVGSEIPEWLDRLHGSLRVRTTINNICVGADVVPVPPGGPMKSLRFLVDLCRQRGIVLPESTLVSTGAVTGVHSVEVGNTARVEFEGFPAIRTAFVAAEPQS